MQWSKVKPYKTGDNDDLYRVYFSDGSYIDATNNHKFLAKHRFQKKYKEYTTLELMQVISDSKYKLSVPRANFKDFDFGINEKYAYEYGFVLGDGTIGNMLKPFADIYYGSNKEFIIFKDVIESLNIKESTKGTKFKTIKFNCLDKTITSDIKYNKGLPEYVLSWNKNSILNFIAGWADADGSNASKGIRIYGDYHKLEIAQLLLTKCGIDSSLNLMAVKNSYSNLGQRKSDIWYLQITKTIDIPCKRLICNNSNKNIMKGKDQIVLKIEKLEGKHKSYCLTEENLHQCVFNNVLTKQCNLNEINASGIDTKEEFLKRVRAATILGTLQSGYDEFPFLGKDSEDLIRHERLLGVSMTGWFDNPKLFNEKWLQEAAEYAKQVNREVADILGINHSARITCVKRLHP